MAYLESLAQRQSGLVQRQPGTPRKPELPGASPTPSKPADKVNPIAVARGPIGRPSQPPPAFPGGTVRTLPNVQQPAGPAPTPSPSLARPAPGPGGGGRGAAQPPAQLATKGVGEIVPGLQQMMDRVPSPAEMAGMDPGVEVVTPYGSMQRDGSIKLSPEGEAKYKEAVVAKRKKLGPHPFAADPNAPTMDVRLGRRMFNPFTGRFIEGD